MNGTSNLLWCLVATDLGLEPAAMQGSKMALSFSNLDIPLNFS